VTSTSGGIFDDEQFELLLSDANGRETGRRPIGRPGANALLVLGDLVAQRDFDT
jgi:hypothetical protein